MKEQKLGKENRFCIMLKQSISEETLKFLKISVFSPNDEDSVVKM